MSGASFRRLNRFVLPALAVFLLGLSSDGQAQKRVAATVQPNKGITTEKQIIDTNAETTDNVAPNIVLSKDGTKGFVSFTGSGFILVFDLETGDVSDRIKTGGKPAFATLLPDERTMAVVSVLEDKVFMVDMESNTLLKTYSFTGAKFGFGSIVTLSSDGSIGYISSTGTGEVIKFTTKDGKETARLKGLEAPAQITLSLDDAIVMVVDALTEELVFVDSSTMTKKKTIKAKDKVTLANFTIFNKAVLSPDGTTGIIASRDANGVLGSDTVFLFKTATGELIDNAKIGSEPGYTTLTPDGKYWVILQEFTLGLINTSDFTDRQELSTVSGEPLGSANVVFTADSKYAFYASSNSDLVFQHDLVTGAVVGRVLVGDNPNVDLDQPSTLAMTPDGKTIAVLDFASSQIDLLKDVWTLDSAKFVSSADAFTGLTLINLSAQPAKFTIFALDNYGDIFAETDQQFVNPAVFTLDPDNQISMTVAQIFKFDDSKERLGWISVFSDQREVAGYLSVGNTSLTTLDGVPLFRGLLFDWIVPEIVKKEGNTNELNIVNPNYNQATYDIDRVQKDGTVAETKSSSTAYSTNRHAQDFKDVFIVSDDVTDGYLREKSTKGLLFTEFFGSDSALGALNGINMDKFVGVKTVYAPQFVVTSGIKTILNVINGSGEDAEVTITLHRANGKVIGAPYTKTLVKNEQIKDDLATIFADDPAVNDVSGWLEIQSDKDRVVGTVTFTNDDGTFLVSFQLEGTPLTRFLFPVTPEDDIYHTGIALLNENDDSAKVTLELWGPGGTLDRSTTLTVDPQSRLSFYLKDYFNDLEPRVNGHLRIRSNQALYGFAMISDTDLNFAAAVPAVPFP